MQATSTSSEQPLENLPKPFKSKAHTRCEGMKFKSHNSLKEDTKRGRRGVGRPACQEWTIFFREGLVCDSLSSRGLSTWFFFCMSSVSPNRTAAVFHRLGICVADQDRSSETPQPDICLAAPNEKRGVLLSCYPGTGTFSSVEESTAGYRSPPAISSGSGERSRPSLWKTTIRKRLSARVAGQSLMKRAEALQHDGWQVKILSAELIAGLPNDAVRKRDVLHNLWSEVIPEAVRGPV